MNIKILVLALTASMAACQETPNETAKDVAQAQETARENTNEARQDASATEVKADEKVADAQVGYQATNETARKKLTLAESDAMKMNATAAFNVTTTEAQGRHEVANQACDALKGAEETSCRSTIDATLESEKAAAIATRDAAMLDAEYHE